MTREMRIKRQTATGNWRILPYELLKSRYGYFVWSKAKLLSDTSYAHEREYFIVKKGWQPQQIRDAVYRYHLFGKDLPEQSRLRALRLEGNTNLVRIERRVEGAWKMVYERELELEKGD